MDSSQQLHNPPLSSTQMESLQKLVKQFKELVGRYQKSCIPQLADSLAAQAAANAATAAAANAANSNQGNQTLHNGQSSAPFVPISGQNGSSKLVPQAALSSGTDHSATHGQPITSAPNVSSIPKGNIVKPPPLNNKLPEVKETAAVVAMTPRPPPAPPSALFPPQQLTNNLSWQCFHSILFYGVGKAPNDGSVGFALSVSRLSFGK